MNQLVGQTGEITEISATGLYVFGWWWPPSALTLAPAAEQPMEQRLEFKVGDKVACQRQTPLVPLGQIGTIIEVGI